MILKRDVLVILNFPDYIDLNEVKKHSKYMSEYLNEHLIDTMRELYKYDKNTLNQVRKELHMRGIGFKKELQNNFLKGIEYNLYPYISVSDEKDRYKSFPFELFGLSQIVSELKISSDKFFNYIPVNGFHKFIPTERKELLISKLEEYGFELIYEHKEVNKKNIESDLDIYKYISDKLFPHFVKYCSDNGYSVVEIDEALKNYKNAKGTRNKTYEKIYQYCIEKGLIEHNSNEKYNLYNHELHELLSAHGKSYLEFMNEYFCEDNLLSDRPYEYGQTVVNDIFENYNVEHESYLINLNSKLTKLTNHDNYILIKDIPISDIINYYELSKIFLKETRLVKELGTKLYDDAIIKILLKFIEELPNFTETNDELFKTVSEKEFKILRDRNNGKTLEEIANQISVTRERVRQIEAKAKRNLKASCELKKTINFIMFKYRNKSIIQLSQILKDVNLDLEYNFVIAILLEESSKYLVNIEYMLLISHKVYRNMQNEVDWYINNENLVIPLNELKYINEENIEFATKLLRGFNYKLVNNNFVKSNLTIVAALEHILYINKEEIFINSHEDYEKLKNKVENLFDKRIDSSPRALFSRVADARNVILIDKNAYKYEDFRDIDGNFLSELKQLVNEEFNQGQYADPRLIYKNNTELMKINKVYSYSHLYSIIKNFFSEDFKVGHQNTLYIYPKESNNLTAEDILTKYLKEHPVVSIDKVLKELKWKRIKLEQIIPRLTDVILNGNQEIILIEGIEEEEGYDELYNLVDNEIEKGYLITADLYTKIAFDENLSLLINKYNIIDLHGFAQFVKSKFMYMMGHSQFLYSKYTEYRNIEDIIVSKLPQMISAKELRDFVVEKGYSEQRYYKTKNLLVDENKITPYSNNIFLNLEKFNFSSNIEDNLLKILKVKLKENIYLTKNQLQEVNVEINESLMATPEIIAHIAKVNGYHLLEAYYGSIYELPIITNKFKTYSELVYTIIKKDFKDIYSEENLLSFLKTRELVTENADQIYFTIKDSDYFTFDNLGFFRLNEGVV